MSDCGRSMAGSFHHQHRRYGRPPAAAKLWRLCPLWQSGRTGQSSSTASTQILHYQESHTGRRVAEGSGSRSPVSLSSVVRSLLPPRRRLRLDPANNLYFPYEPGKQVRSAVKIKNASKSHVAFKFQTTSPKSCYMRPPGGILGPGESLVATVFKFVEQPENNEKQLEQKCRVKFRIMSQKVAGGTEFVPELFDEQKQEVVVERVLRVVFLDVAHPSAAMEKLKCQLSEAEASLEVHRKAPADTGPRLFGGLVIDEWKERREKYLARQQVEAVDSF